MEKELTIEELTQAYIEHAVPLVHAVKSNLLEELQPSTTDDAPYFEITTIFGEESLIHIQAHMPGYSVTLVEITLTDKEEALD
jgi:hypothetical protein